MLENPAIRAQNYQNDLDSKAAADKENGENIWLVDGYEEFDTAKAALERIIEIIPTENDESELELIWQWRDSYSGSRYSEIEKTWLYYVDKGRLVCKGGDGSFEVIKQEV